MTDQFKVIIIGTGITGCSLAHGLQKKGIAFEIFEKHGPVARPRDWGVTIHWAVEYLGLYPDEMKSRLPSAQVIPSRVGEHEFVQFYNGETGEVIKEIPLGPAKRYSHKKLRTLLAEGILIQYNKALQSISEVPDGIEVLFADGSRATGSLLIACDGSQSDTRQHLFENADDAKWNPLPGFVLNNFWMQYPAEQAKILKAGLHAFLDISVHPNGTYYGIIRLMGLPSAIKPEDDSAAKRVQMVREAGKHFFEPFRSALEWMSDDTFISPDRYGTWETKRWDHKGGRVILAGDAAHAMTAHRAQGLNHALQDVINIVNAMDGIVAGETPLVDLVEKYVDEVAERGAEEVRMSLKQGLAVHNWELVAGMPIKSIGTTPLHMEQTLVPLPSA